MRPITLAKYHFLSLWNWRSSYIGRFIEPLAYLAFLAAGLSSSVVLPSGNYPEFVLAGMACIVTFRAATSSLSDVANDRKWGVFAIYSMQGGSTLGYLASILMFAGAVYAAQMTLLIALALALFGVSAFSVAALLGIFLLGLLVAVGWIGFGAAVGARVQSYSARDLIVTLTTLPVILAAPLFYPLDGAPTYLVWISRANPLTYQVGWMRTPEWESVALATMWAVAGIIVGVVALRSADRVSRER
ncbi:MAG: ABC transporter permease [Rhodoglobus sp.]